MTAIPQRLPDLSLTETRTKVPHRNVNVKYYSASDMLTIDLSEAPARGGGEEVAEGVVFSYDADDKLVGIEISGSSERVDLTDIVGNPNAVIDDAGPPLTVYT